MHRDDRLYLIQVMLAQGRDAEDNHDRQEHYWRSCVFYRREKE